jgi:hypothetical protein
LMKRSRGVGPRESPFLSMILALGNCPRAHDLELEDGETGN